MSTQPFGHAMHSTDGKGHGDYRRVKFPPEVLYMAEQIVGTKAWPYRTFSDLVRDGLVRLMAELHDADPNTLPDYPLYQVALELRVRKERREFLSQVVHDLGKDFALAKDHEEVLQLTKEANDLLGTEDMPSHVRRDVQYLLDRWS